MSDLRLAGGVLFRPSLLLEDKQEKGEEQRPFTSIILIENPTKLPRGGGEPRLNSPPLRVITNECWRGSKNFAHSPIVNPLISLAF